MPEVAIRMTDVHRSYGSGETEVRALRGANLELAAGEIVALTGPSGSGKTTLLNCLLGLDQPDEGTVRVFETDVTGLGYEQAVAWRRSEVAIVFQATGLLPHLSASENVDIALRVRGIARDERMSRIDATFAELGILEYSQHQPAELSGGQRQRVSLARALASRPRLLVADEPTGELDSETTAHTLEVLRAASQAHNTTLIMATHDSAAEEVADRTLRMLDGQLS